jgi:hypothetical protein
VDQEALLPIIPGHGRYGKEDSNDQANKPRDSEIAKCSPEFGSKFEVPLIEPS